MITDEKDRNDAVAECSDRDLPLRDWLLSDCRDVVECIRSTGVLGRLADDDDDDRPRLDMLPPLPLSTAAVSNGSKTIADRRDANVAIRVSNCASVSGRVEKRAYSYWIKKSSASDGGSMTLREDKRAR